MSTQRLEAFSDGVIAIIITIMVLELKAPHEPTWAALAAQWPVFISYVLSYTYVGIYWNNHHHLLHLTDKASGGVMWANLTLLFWMSLIPFVTAWMDENHFAPVPTATYGAVLLATAVAFLVLENRILKAGGPQSRLRQAIGRDWKGKLSALCYAVGIATAFVSPLAANATYFVVAAIWFVPDPRMRRAIEAE